ncbi:MAG: hypothetical protein PEGG_01157 [Paraeggerthella hongkongensis]|jgi:GTP cyclohydrolase III|uniref:dynein gamma chain protein n=1 Tax=Paraeggerthella TaxID=651554 RepID=UPI000DF7A3F2|nr:MULTISPECIES: dynein gamma chain protein [Paraeggerthella]MBU5405413.1 dynein gamma chain protein [Paraeggerthella hongkongensis]MCD2432465.1 dynein gamma chain protein [Paraeggerthella hominis]MDY3981607.1 dynein gamma chain protein [Paraeggerthella sp.]RDB58268.1 dynein gamma chain protein [Paraeggerthella hongkongensis]
MCTNGINTGQFEQMIDQIDDHIKLERRWAHSLGHTAGDAGYATVSEKLHAAQALLDDVRALLDEAKDALEDDAESAGGVTVSLV